MTDENKPARTRTSVRPQAPSPTFTATQIPEPPRVFTKDEVAESARKVWNANWITSVTHEEKLATTFVDVVPPREAVLTFPPDFDVEALRGLGVGAHIIGERQHATEWPYRVEFVHPLTGRTLSVICRREWLLENR